MVQALLYSDEEPSTIVCKALIIRFSGFAKHSKRRAPLCEKPCKLHY
jgi:hypothetical protein